MFTITNFLRFLMAAAMATACSMVLLSPSSCPCSSTWPNQLELASGNNNASQQADPSIRVRLVHPEKLTWYVAINR
jgi:hypothetical protein